MSLPRVSVSSESIPPFLSRWEINIEVGKLDVVVSRVLPISSTTDCETRDQTGVAISSRLFFRYNRFVLRGRVINSN